MAMSMDITWNSQGMETLARQDAPRSKRELLRAARRVGIQSQAELARRLGRNPSYLARVLSKRVASRVVWAEAWAIVRTAVNLTSPDVTSVMSMDMSTGRAGSRDAG